MCDPTALLATSLAVGALGTVTTAFGQYQQAQAANRAAEYNAKIADYNAQAANAQAANAIARGAVEEKQQRLQVAKTIGTQRAGFGGSGLLVDQGTASDVTSDTAGFGELDALTIRNNAAMEAWGIKNQAANYSMQANLARSSKQNGLLAAGGSLLTGMSSLAGSLYQNRSALFDDRPPSIKALPV
jgi:hypothetical protein